MRLKLILRIEDFYYNRFYHFNIVTDVESMIFLINIFYVSSIQKRLQTGSELLIVTLDMNRGYLTNYTILISLQLSCQLLYFIFIYFV